MLKPANVFCAKAQCNAAAATNVFCTKAKRQQQMFFARKRSDSSKCFLCESAVQRSGSNRCFLRESEATAADVFFVRKRSDSNKMLVTQSLQQDVAFLE
ncbi:hypothetical protein ACQKNC_21410 [Lysinibacillus sp. NPDC094177]|uniref:hypothetical protein n=1 Tax=Lysinibacillus sp. NPDC094177 TaxID=3390580 RepID=UPI003CFEFF60